MHAVIKMKTENVMAKNNRKLKKKNWKLQSENQYMPINVEELT